MEPITINKLTFAYSGQEPLFTNCTLDLNSDWKLGLLGRNGRGKTTLMRILLGQVNFTGTIISKLTFSYFPLKIKDPRQFAGEAVLAAVSVSTREQWQLERELNLMGVDPALLWQSYESLSGGEQTKVQLAALFALDGNFLLLDEPTNHLDQHGRQQVADYLAKKQQGFIITSHDQAFLDQVIDHTLVIERHQLVLSHGNYSTYFQQKHRRDQEALANNRQLRSEIKSLKNSRQQRLQWAQRAEGKKKHNSHADKGFIGAKAAKMMKKAMTTAGRLDAAIKDRQGLLRELEDVDRLPLNNLPSHHTTQLKVEEVTLTIAGRQLFKPVSFKVDAHDQVALIGPNGAGKSSLLNAIQGNLTAQATGTITLANTIKISCVRQNYATNHGHLADFAEANGLAYDLLLNILRKLGMERATFRIPIEEMSMGQQKKVEFARSLATPAQLYLWDEPLNYLDTYNQQQLIQLVNGYRPPLLFVEHDKHFIEAVASKQVLIQPFPGK